jgi:hypothetical protein
MIGLLQELGPCRIANDSRTVTLNPYSWNNEANVLFIDQPVGVGFSHGTESVGTSEEAAADVWKFLQIFLADSRFAHLAANDLAIWTESCVPISLPVCRQGAKQAMQIWRPLRPQLRLVLSLPERRHRSGHGDWPDPQPQDARNRERVDRAS